MPETFEKNLERQLKRVRGETGDPPEILYHYTSLAGFKGIVDSKELWATSIHYLNDEREFLEALRILSNAVEERIGANEEGPVREFYKEVSLHRAALATMTLYVFALTRHGDLLSQWRGYCPAGQGYSLGFDARQLVQLVQRADFRIEQCVYDEREQERLVNIVLTKHVTPILEAMDADLDDPQSDLLGFLTDFLHIAPRIKNDAFAQEEEWRLVSLITQPSNDHVNYRLGKTMLVPQFAIPVDPLPIKEVIVGPTPHKDLAVRAAQEYLLKSGVKAEVKLSKVPFRTH